MDDYKRSIYIEVHRRLHLPFSEKNKRYICYLLKDILEQEGFKTVSQLTLRVLFPDFYSLFDGYSYTEKDLKIYEKKEASMVFDPWRERYDTKPRIHIINYLLQS